MVDSPPEPWRPPLFEGPTAGVVAQCRSALRRFLDLQAGSVWNDVAAVLPYIRGRVLDVGCGAQPYRPLLGPQTEYVGIDTIDAEAHFGYKMPDTTYFEGEVWPVENASVDLVFSTETIEHILEYRLFLAEASRCLRDRGTILLTFPFAARWHFVPFDYWRFTPSAINYLLRTAGFVDVRVYARGNAITVACYKVMALILPLLVAQNCRGATKWALRFCGLCLSPFFVLLAGIANLSLRGRGGNDCLGYTVLAEKKGSTPNA